MTTIDKLGRFLDNLDKEGYDAEKIIAHMSEVEDLNEEKENAKRERDGAISGTVEAEKKRSEIQTEVGEGLATKERLSAENAKAEKKLAATEKKAKANSDRIEFADAMILLFSDISQISPMLLMELLATLEMNLKARFNPESIYPIDYEGARAKAVALLEQALGKKLVPRDIFDEMLNRAVKMYDDLMFDKLGKMEREKASLEGARSLIDALSAGGKRFIVHRECRACGRLIAAFPVGTRCSIAKCAFCDTTNP